MALITLEDAKNYLRVDTDADDALIGSLLLSAGQLCADVARLADDEWSQVNGEPHEEDSAETVSLRASLRVVEEFVPSAGHEIGRHGEFRREGFSERHCLFPLLTVGIAWSLHKPIVGRLPHGLLVSCVF